MRIHERIHPLIVEKNLLSKEEKRYAGHFSTALLERVLLNSVDLYIRRNSANVSAKSVVSATIPPQFRHPL
jgi:hypothetical protein